MVTDNPGYLIFEGTITKGRNVAICKILYLNEDVFALQASGLTVWSKLPIFSC